MAQDDNSLSRPNLPCGRSQKNWSEQKEPRSRSTLIAGEKEQKVPLLLLSILHFLGWRREEISLVFWWRWRGRGEGAVRYIAKGGAGIEGGGGDLLLLLVSHRRRRRRALPPSYYTTDPTTTDCSRGTETESPAFCGNGGGGGPSAAEKSQIEFAK